jgi:CBS domain containing-hemolysin-like protein
VNGFEVGLIVLSVVEVLVAVVAIVFAVRRKLSGGKFTSEAELRELVDQAEERDLIEDGERKMIHSVFELGDTIVKEVMVPRTEMISISANRLLQQGISLALRSGFSRIPVIGGDVDDIVGVFYFKDAISRTYESPNTAAGETVAQVMRPPTFVPDSKPVDDLLRQMQQERVHVVIVVDEFGGTAGLATIEDLLEEIVGEIVDEYDQEVSPIADLGDGRFRVSARLPIDDLGEPFGLEVDDEDVDTVLGLVAKVLGKVPIPGASVTWNGIKLTAEPGNNRRHAIQTLLAERADEELADAAAQASSTGQEA